MSTFALDVSDDGSIVVGYSRLMSAPFTNFEAALRWDTSGFSTLTPRAGTNGAAAAAVSSDGNIVAGKSFNMAGGGNWAVRWATPTSPPTTLGAFGTPGRFNIATGMSGDGNVVVGHNFNSGGLMPEAFRWDSINGFQPLVGTNAEPRGVNHDGSLIVGNVDSYATVWTVSGATQLPGELNRSTFASDVSADGRTIVGRWTILPSGATVPMNSAAVWRDGLVSDLGILNGFVSSAAAETSDDGMIFVGAATGPDSARAAVLWLPGSGPLDLQQTLNLWGVATPGWVLQEATAISGDGSTIVGNGLLNGVPSAWKVTLPAPGSGALMAVALAVLNRRRRMPR